jgi:hypothetical protein
MGASPRLPTIPEVPVTYVLEMMAALLNENDVAV